MRHLLTSTIKVILYYPTFATTTEMFVTLERDFRGIKKLR